MLPKSQEALLSLFHSKGRLISLRKKELFAKQGLALDSIGYIVSGCFKLVYKRGKKEWIKSFVFPGGLLGSIPSILQKKPSTYLIQAMERSEVIVLPSRLLFETLSQSNSYLSILNDFLSELYLKKEERVADFLLLEPEERYKKFLEQYREHLDSISQIDQAAYLGITNVALSRIKARVFAPKSPKPRHTVR
ncbi:cyclic nucleotide-binding domain protein [Leptospira ryugenii]|uniref:Cyclic nucleotide-binding domain protein n=1 Tax=Leptospira ryugenii TaxID=1917863 RepID=A0A2P2E406_9LEPT|nr:Crp/Fnr family transcriptional regulator [Leptospira ryugenii]GBF51615.1 cyclic nucleotide-binding domain protein [Leptospira ryugenii]